MVDGPHAGQPVRTAGADLDDADAAVVAVHGRGARAESVLSLAGEFDVDGVAYLGPQAARNTWYPNRFVAPIEDNEPHLSSALSFVDETVQRAVDAGISRERIVLLGFSQGACLASEYVARNPRRWGGLAAFSGGLIGPPGTEFEYDGDLDGTPAFVGCSDSDPHIPEERVHETTEALEALGADVTERLYPGMGHTINQDETEFVAGMLADLV
ncbi:alpha/beta hydrolase [Halomicrobium salinisoli]|uniref:alpha/beta hydrolase n=1 Tax=Halomicrobium salinisoli TaxID=2878391 RepID=UPI001CEFD3BB|nr:dienelactone hydrolase family protein [Halomicrobium salinisoli]